MRIAEMTIQGITIPAHDITITPPKISPDDLMEVVEQEADHCTIKSGNSKKDEKDTTFSPREGKEVVGNLTSSTIIATRRAISRPTVGQKAVVKKGKARKARGNHRPKGGRLQWQMLTLMIQHGW
jgi:hypothetical protein